MESEYYRISGNSHYKQHKFYEALIDYNKAISSVKQEADSLGLAYANRSAVYCEVQMYEKAIENINLARQNGYSTEKLHNLNAREEKCKLMLKNGVEGEFNPWNFFKLSYPANKKIPFIANCLKLSEDEEGNQAIITTSKLEAGDVIAIEEPLFKIAEKKYAMNFCACCFKSNDFSLIPCNQCSEAMYCSEECKIYNSSHHVNDHFNFDLLRNTMRIVQESIKIAGGVDELLQLLKITGSKSVFDFDLSNPENPSYKKNLLVALNKDYKEVFYPENLASLLSRHIDFPPINEKPRSPSEREALIKFILNQDNVSKINMHGFVRELSLGSKFAEAGSPESKPQICFKPIGSGNFPLASLMNSSHEANIEFATIEGKLAVVVKFPIKAGDEIAASCCECKGCRKDWKNHMKKDKKFIAPHVSSTIAGQDAVDQFKKNCAYINKNFKNHPCFEVSYLMKQNERLVKHITLNNKFYKDTL